MNNVCACKNKTFTAYVFLAAPSTGEIQSESNLNCCRMALHDKPRFHCLIVYYPAGV